MVLRLIALAVVLSLLTFIVVFANLLSEVFIYPQNSVKNYVPDLGMLLASIFALAFALKGIKWLQFRKVFLTKRPYDIDLPKELDTLMAQLRAGDVRAYTSVGYGVADLNAKETSDLSLLGGRISRETFTNRYAPLLLSAQKKSWAFFWLSFRKSIASPIYIENPEYSAGNIALLGGISSGFLDRTESPI